jgi:hypothetical protein
MTLGVVVAGYGLVVVGEDVPIPDSRHRRRNTTWAEIPD